MKRWYLMRHGQTDYNRRRCFYGSHDVSINEQGQKDAKQLALLMQEHPVDVIYTSSLKRTKETARLAFPERKAQPIADFDERGFGQWEGLTADEIEAAFQKSGRLGWRLPLRSRLLRQKCSLTFRPESGQQQTAC